MSIIRTAPALADQVYEALVDDICSGKLAAGIHLKQEQLADQLGVSRQPVQQAMALLKADGLVEDVGKRGLRVSPLDLGEMRHHYEIRALLDGFAARSTSLRLSQDPSLREAFEQQVTSILDAGKSAVSEGDVSAMVKHDQAFHQLFYDMSGNPLVVKSADPHCRYLRRVMGDVLRHAEPPREVWQQHEEIANATLAGEAETAQRLMEEHANGAAQLLTDNFVHKDAGAS